MHNPDHCLGKPKKIIYYSDSDSDSDDNNDQSDESDEYK